MYILIGRDVMGKLFKRSNWEIDEKGYGFEKNLNYW